MFLSNLIDCQFKELTPFTYCRVIVRKVNINNVDTCKQ